MCRLACVIASGFLLAGGGGCSASQATAPASSPVTAATFGTKIETTEPGRGRIRISVTPLEAEIGIDGVTQGLASDFIAPASIDLDPGTHRIEVRLVGFETYRAEVYVAADVTETIPVKLRRLPAMPKDPDDKDKETSQ